jgi:predicted small secreted protein
VKNFILAALILAAAITLTGCGETVSGVGKDINRMGRGVSTFFFRQ